MRVLSLFDGISCGQLALNRAGIKYDTYYASEIDKYAMAVTQYHYPNTIQLGDIKEWRDWNLPQIDLLIGGSPCQGFSSAGKQLNFNDDRSKLFFEFVDILHHYKPKYFLLENVRMKQEWQDVISEQLGVQPILIDSALVSAQSRKRLYWTNISNVTQPKDKGLLLQDIVENGFVDRNKAYCLKSSYKPTLKSYLHKNKNQIVFCNWNGKTTKNKIISIGSCADEKSSCIVWNNGGKGPAVIFYTDLSFRKLTTIECERLQTIPDNYTLVPYQNKMMSNAQRYKMLGNAWTVDIIVHIFNALKGVL